MSKLPILSGKDLVKFFVKQGYSTSHQTGSHMILENLNGKILVIPKHKEVSTGTLRAIIRQSGLSREEFMEIYSKYF